MYQKTGVISEEKINELLPSRERREKGPYAIFECVERIPCDPCYTNCNLDAVTPMEDINDLPEVIYENCTGCGVCVGNCPGLACFVVDETFSENRASLQIPYEVRPLPEKGQKMMGLDRKGEPVCEVEILSVNDSKRLDNTCIITLAVPQEYIHKVRNIEMGAQ